MRKDTRQRSSLRAGLALVVIVALIALGGGQTLTTAQSSEVVALLEVGNTQCQVNVQISQMIWLQGASVIKVRFVTPALQVPPGETRQFQEQLEAAPTAVQIGGAIGDASFSLRVEPGTARYECGTIRLQIEGQPGQGTAPGLPEELPPNFPPLQPGMTPEQVTQTLQNRGFSGNVQGSRTNPKVSGVEDPQLIRELQAGAFFDALFVTSGSNSLRAAINWDEPSVPVALLVLGLGVPSSFCLHFPLSGGIMAHCDRPQAQSAAFTSKTPPASATMTGSPFFLVAFKLGGPATAYVLSLAP